MKPQQTSWEESFKLFHDENENGGSSRWKVSPTTVLVFFKGVLSSHDAELREKIENVMCFDRPSKCYCGEGVHDLQSEILALLPEKK